MTAPVAGCGRIPKNSDKPVLSKVKYTLSIGDQVNLKADDSPRALTGWQAESLRLTAFPNPSATVAESTWWKDIVGQPSETRISKPLKSFYREEGTYESGTLALDVQPNRIDWVLKPLEKEKESLGKVPLLGPFPDALNSFRQLAQRWLNLETCPPIKRLAFGAILLEPVDSIHVGYRRLSRYLPLLQLDAGGLSDFLYQINRPRDSTPGVHGLRINRLSKWSVANVRLIPFDPASLDNVPIHEEVFCRLELDISTAAEFPNELPRKSQYEIFLELTNLGKEVSEKGDIP